MFNCYLHGWSHGQQACPVCFPVYGYTSSDTGKILLGPFCVHEFKHMIAGEEKPRKCVYCGFIETEDET